MDSGKTSRKDDGREITMNKIKVFLPLNLQLFGEGGGASSAAQGVSGEVSTGTSDVSQDTKTEQQGDAETNPDNQKQLGGDEDFHSLIKGKYSKEYQESVDKLFNRRFAKEKAEKEILRQSFDKVNSVATKLAARYGVDPTDVEALEKAMENDQDFIEYKAMQQGLPTDVYKRTLTMQEQLLQEKQQNEQHRQRQRFEQQEYEKQQIYDQLNQEAEEIRATFDPNFDLESALENQDLLKLLSSNVPLVHAYKVLNIDSLMDKQTKATAQATKEGVARSIAANGMRPLENGASGKPSAPIKPNMDNLSKQAMKEIDERVARGEKVGLKELTSYMTQ